MTSFRILGLGLDWGVPLDVQRFHGTFSEYPGWKWALLWRCFIGYLFLVHVLEFKNTLMCTIDHHHLESTLR